MLEANPRASRTVPFVSKATGVSLARVATWCSPGGRSPIWRPACRAGRSSSHYRRLPYTSVKAAVLPFGRFPGVDTGPGPRDEVHGRGHGDRRDSGMALAKAMVAAGRAAAGGTVFISVANRDKRAIVFPPSAWQTSGSASSPPVAGGSAAPRRDRRGAGREDRAKAPTTSGHDPRQPVDLVINTPFGRGPRSDGYFIRTAAVAAGAPASRRCRVCSRRSRHRGAPLATHRAPVGPGVPCRAMAEPMQGATHVRDDGGGRREASA